MRGWRMVWPSDHWNFAAWARWICTLPSPPAMLLGDPPNAGRDPRTALGVMTNESESRHFFFLTFNYNYIYIYIFFLNLHGFPSLTTFSWFCHSNSRIFAIIGLLGNAGVLWPRPSMRWTKQACCRRWETWDVERFKIVLPCFFS